MLPGQKNLPHKPPAKSNYDQDKDEGEKRTALISSNITY